MVDLTRAQGRLTTKRKLDEMSWAEIKAALDNGQRVVVAAAGSMEQHGPHLPLQTDTLIGTFVVEAVVERLPGVLQGPTIPFGVSTHHMAFAGTITLDIATFKAVVRQYVASLAEHGFEHVFILPTHGGNFGPIGQLMEETHGRIGAAQFHGYHDQIAFVDLMVEIAEAQGVTAAAAGGHAGEVETSLILAARTELVEMAYAEEGYLGPMNRESIHELMTKGMTALTSNGILGDGRPAVIEHGFAYRDAIADAIADALAGWVRERLPDTTLQS